MSIFKIGSPIFNGLSRIFDILLLNFLWILCSIPVITIGASTAALYYCMMKINRERDSGIVEMFFKSFRQNFKQGCILTIIFIFSGIFLYVDIQACKAIGGALENIIIVILLVLVVIWGIMISYTFPLLAQFDNTLINTLKNSLLLAISNIKKTVPIFILNAVPVVLFFGFPYAFVFCIPLLLTFGAALISFFNSKILISVFDKYMQS